jgi:spore germination protein
MVFIIFLTLTTSSTIDTPKIVAETAGRSGWIPILLVSVIFAAAAVIITKLNNMYQTKVMFDYSQEIVGKFFTCLIVAYYIFYFLLIGIYLKLRFVGLLQSNFLHNTSPVIMIFFGIATFCYSAYKGITNIARAFEIVGITFLVTTVVICIFMVTEGMHYNILPLYNPTDLKMFPEAMKQLVLPFGGLELLLIIPFTDKNKKAPKTAFFLLCLIGLFYILITESTFMIMGLNNTIALTDSFIEAIKLVEIPIIERTDTFYLTFGLMSLFAGMIIIDTAILELTCRTFKKMKRSAATIVIGGILFVLTIIGMSIKNFEEVFARFATVPMLLSGVLIPAALFITAKIKKFMRKGQQDV